MIQPIYFPFTYVPQWVAAAFAAGFEKFCVYQPSGKELPVEMQTWVEREEMTVCVPVAAKDKDFTAVVSEFQRFASLHADDKTLRTGAFWNQPGAAPFFHESSASQIVADLRKDNSADTALTGSEALLRARVFLEFAQNFDRQNAELLHQLEDTDRRSADLIKNLSGENHDSAAVTPLTARIKMDDPGEYMAQDRLQAWIRLYLEKPAEAGLLVTSSPSIYDFLIDRLPAAEKLGASKTPLAPVANDGANHAWREAFLQQLNNLTQTSDSAGEDPFGRGLRSDTPTPRFMLTLYRLPGSNPVQLMSRFLSSPSRTKDKSIQMTDIKNTLLGLIEPSAAIT
ncbi:MAG: hypothetical protein R3274_05855 [Desulfobacterales bacterium]|nr:hypothetical protein [Desulfobacterales bacterium]